MHICYVADARSPIAKNWISHFVARNYRVTVISSYPCRSDEIPGAEVLELPFALSSLSGIRHRVQNGSGELSKLQKTVARVRSGRLSGAVDQVRAWAAPFSIRARAEQLTALIDDLRPDLVHAMRLPYEGFIAAAAVTTRPLLLSIWGNDFTLFADRSRRLSKLTDLALRRANGLQCDCRRDLDMAFSRGFSRQKPWRVLPGGGGVDINRPAQQPDRDLMRQFQIRPGAQLVINPRGVRSYVRNDVFFRAIPLVLQRVPQALFIAIGMQGNPAAERWTKKLRIQDSVRLLPTVSHQQLASLFAASQVSVSPSSHDGTPNTLLEAMTCGCFPVMGRIESLREWIIDGQNGFFCDQSDANSLASCIIRALQSPALRTAAAKINRDLIRARADRAAVMFQAEALYAEIVHGLKRSGSQLEAELSDSLDMNLRV
jgi:glycosyltransferase involved in cell wall biosynthesis